MRQRVVSWYQGEDEKETGRTHLARRQSRDLGESSGSESAESGSDEELHLECGGRC
jgi:hypothetical protein